MTTESRLASLIPAAIDAMRVDLKQDLQEFVEGAIESHRRRMWVSEKWCCRDMQTFAKEVWNAPNPPTRDETTFGGVQLQLRGLNVNYCPFCGVLVASKKS